MDSLPVTHYSRYASTEPPKASICIVGGTNIAHALVTSSHVAIAFTLETRFGSSPSVYYGEFEGAPFYHVTLHGSCTAASGVAEQESLLRVWGTLHHLGVSDVLGGATAGSINPAYKLGDWVIADDFIDFNIDWKTLSDLYPRLRAQSIDIYLATVRRIHHLPERRRIGDTLRVHPDFD